MAMQKRLRVQFEDVFGFGAYLVSEVGPVLDFDRSTRETKVQALDKDSGLPVWSVDVLDADPEAVKRSRTVTIKLAGKVQPVPPANSSGSPFTPIAFVGLSALAYIEEGGPRPRIAWSFRADGMCSPKDLPAVSASAAKAVA